MADTTDRDYADLLARLYEIPVQTPERRTYTKAQEQALLVEDLINEQGEATW